MKKVVNPTEYKKSVEYWDKGDGKTNQLQTKEVIFQSPDIDIVIYDEPVCIKAGGEAILPDSVAQTLLVRFPHLSVSEYIKKPEKIKGTKAKKVEKTTKKVAAKRVPKKKYGKKNK